MKTFQFLIQNRSCILFSTPSPKFLLIQPTGTHELETLEQEVSTIAESGAEFLFVAFPIQNWNTELCPWQAKQAFGNEPFGAGAPETFRFITEDLIPALQENYSVIKVPCILGGYSLAGLFALWSAYKTNLFSGIAACSPSLWIDGWEEFSTTHTPHCSNIYLSIGNKEHKTRNPLLQKSKVKLTNQYTLLQTQNIQTVLEINSGNHFQDCAIRTAKGFLWCIHTIENQA